MPRTMQEIFDQAEALAQRFEDFDPPLTAHGQKLRDAALRRAKAERALADAVQRARAAGMSWRQVGSLVGTTGEAARQRYGASGV